MCQTKAKWRTLFSRKCITDPFSEHEVTHRSGLYNLRSRYYDPETGRFVSADHPSYLRTGMPNGLNPYAYCYNNPVRYSDQNGHFGLIGLLIAAAVLLTVSVVDAVIGTVAYYVYENNQAIEYDGEGGIRIKGGWALPGFFSKMAFLALASSSEKFNPANKQVTRTIWDQTIEWWGHNAVSYPCLFLAGREIMNKVANENNLYEKTLSYPLRLFIKHTKDVDIENDSNWWLIWD